MSHPQTFHLGITMAGAVSAGAYTAGAMDYLIETLNNWETAKKSGDPSIPQHRVIIEALGGASAGGMTAAISLMALQHHIPKVENISSKETGNLLFDLWVNLVDDSKESTLDKMLHLDDITEEDGVPSLLNSKPIIDLAQKAAAVPPGPLPAYISSDLDILLTLCNLRGIPIDIEFSVRRSLGSTPPSHKVSLHRLLAHFKLNPPENSNGDYLPLDLNKYTDVELLIKCAQATGAFPIGLKSRLIDHPYFSEHYIKASSLRNLRIANWQDAKADWEATSTPFVTQVIDGGTTNNEPFGEIAHVLSEKAKNNGDDPNSDFKNYGLIMIDPFPNFEKEAGPYTPPKSLRELVGPILGALRQQALFKGQDFVDNINGSYPRGMIFPVRWKPRSVWETEGSKYLYPIASSALDGFGGFFSREFRVHDYLLGRQNCQKFLQFFFCFPEGEKLHPIHESWSPAMKEAFRFRDKQGQAFLPIIPDISTMNKQDAEDNPFAYDFEYPQISADEIMKYRPQLEARFEKILKYFHYPEQENIQIGDLENFLSGHYKRNWFHRNIGSGIQNRIINNRVLPGLAKNITKEVLRYILEDMHQMGLLKF